MSESISPVTSVDGRELRELFAAATAWLDAHHERVNAVNVFPVPDGDTGTNMLLTMRSTMKEAQECDEAGAGAMLAAMSHGALMGARGNSGVILSQIVRGMSGVVDGAGDLDAALFADGLKAASETAYRAVTEPTEGTILTVIREVADAVNGDGKDMRDMVACLDLAVETAKVSVEKTPELLPVLKEAGVVDAGGLGLLILLEGMLRYVRGEMTGEPAVEMGSIEEEWLSATEERHAVEESPYGYCTEVLIAGKAFDVDGMRERVGELGDSVLVVGDDSLMRVHVHTDDPGALLSLGTKAGMLEQVKVDNIRGQAERFVEMHHEAERAAVAPSAAPTGSMSCVAVASGDGMIEVFRSVGGTHIVEGGPTMNPSAKEILDAIEACPTGDVVVLPNDKNIIMAAEQAATQSDKRVQVVRTRSLPQGIAAVLAVNPEDDFEENVRAMEGAVGSVKTVELTKAVRSTSVKGVEVAEGQAIAIVDDELTLGAESVDQAAVQVLDTLARDDGSTLISLYYGAEKTEAEAEALAEKLQDRFPEHEIEVVYGGQPHYDYIISVE